MLIIFNWITIQSIILHSILFNCGSVHICENSNNIGRITSQSKVENETAAYRTAAMKFTAILDLEARGKAKEVSKARKRKIRCLKQQQRMRQFSNTLHRPFLGLFCPIRVSCCARCPCCTASSLHKAIKSLVSSKHNVSAILFNYAL